MLQLKNQVRLDQVIIKLLKVEYVSTPICNTSKGLLSLVLRKDEEKPYFVLDAVPLSQEQNDYLFKTLYETVQSKEEGNVKRA